MLTRIGCDNLLTAYAHVAHDVRIGDHSVLSHGVTLGGHVAIGDWAVVGAHSGVHQFCRVGRHAMIGGYSVVTQDVLPFATTVSTRENQDLRREPQSASSAADFSRSRSRRLQTAFRLSDPSGLNTTQAIERIRAEVPLRRRSRS